ncbi:hypothetical protein [Nostoc sp. MS1]|uniref:hypothetical protein n=1 Tax=Nostoc sp. MS1 TaxID=2764711 RepID=UPI001CC5A640|nr:hypothetical protein [Nostoc sp. MS1]
MLPSDLIATGLRLFVRFSYLLWRSLNRQAERHLAHALCIVKPVVRPRLPRSLPPHLHGRASPGLRPIKVAWIFRNSCEAIALGVSLQVNYCDR